ncbi:MAG TPA: His/Gly/Thr/Pro-type tRNA ligase C-terminal domain-containing protein, partial [Candidatus Kapabacteria bacterium]|nr:His/Gly/Thr/Pro-type tRNA ligase C-terminal domain-containing protein [Candidatus Kapabacteria bacterium]
PVIIHRAPFGSFERFISLLIEHYAGNFPTWLAPVQCAVLPITDAQAGYAEEVTAKLRKMGVRVVLDASNEKVNARIRDQEMMKVPIMFVLGAKEAEANLVALRRHGKGNIGTIPLEEALSLVAKESVIPE